MHGSFRSGATPGRAHLAGEVRSCQRLCALHSRRHPSDKLPSMPRSPTCHNMDALAAIAPANSGARAPAAGSPEQRVPEAPAAAAVSVGQDPLPQPLISFICVLPGSSIGLAFELLCSLERPGHAAAPRLALPPLP